MNKLSVIAGKSSEDLAKKLSKRIKADFVKSEIRIFADGESKITLNGKISKKKSIVVQSIYPPVDTNLIQALSLISKAREISSEVVAVIPYMGYARQDREFLPGEIVTMKVLGKLFKGAGASTIIAVDIHSMIGFKHFTIKTKNVSAIPELVQYIKKLSLKNPLVVSPDQGGKDRAKEFAKELGSEYIALEKIRDRKTGKVQIKTKNLDEVANRDLILVDDMISTGGSIVKATQFLKKQKCKKIYVACTHALLMNGAEKEIKKAGVTKIISSNTIPGKTSIVDISDTIAKAI
ncbi:MAG: ribose-phosphate diphosphokinase [Candidatus Nitrosopumilus sp. bin_32a]